MVNRRRMQASKALNHNQQFSNSSSTTLGRRHRQIGSSSSDHFGANSQANATRTPKDCQLKRKLTAELEKQKLKSIRLVKTFRACNPDEFGFITKENFCTSFGNHFKLRRSEAEKLYTQLDTNGEKEISFRAVTKLLGNYAAKTKQSSGDASPKTGLVKPDLNSCDVTFRNRYRAYHKLQKLLKRNRFDSLTKNILSSTGHCV